MIQLDFLTNSACLLWPFLIGPAILLTFIRQVFFIKCFFAMAMTFCLQCQILIFLCTLYTCATTFVGSAAMRQKMDDQQTRLQDLKFKFQESEAAKGRIKGMIECLKKHREETNALLRRMLCLNREQVLTTRFVMWSIYFATCGQIVVSALWRLVCTFLL